MANRSRGRAPLRRADRLMVWLGVDIDLINVAAATPILAGTLNAAALAIRPFTIVRIRGMVQWNSDQSAASESPGGAVGEIVVSEAAAAAGVGSVPTPTTESDGNWMVYQLLLSVFTLGDATGFEEVTGKGSYWEIDSKAMRKVGIDDQLALVVENADASFGAQFKMIGRILVKLH